MAWEAMQKFTKEVIDHMDWDMGLDKFIKASPQDPPLMEVQVKGLSQVHGSFWDGGPAFGQSWGRQSQ